MAEIRLDGGTEKSRSMWVPIVLALVVLAAAGAWFGRTYLHPSVNGAVDSVVLYPVHVEYKRGSGMLVGENQTEDALYVVASVSLTDRSEVPLFIKAIHGSFTADDGSEAIANVIDKNDLPRLMAMYPQLKAKTDALGVAPLNREDKVQPGATGKGWVVMVYNFPQTIWDKRKDASVSIDFYHQDTMTMALPK